MPRIHSQNAKIFQFYYIKLYKSTKSYIVIEHVCRNVQNVNKAKNIWLVGWLVEPETCATPVGGIVSINPEVKSLHEVRRKKRGKECK